MTSRVVWLAAGAVAGVYASAKARRAAYRLSVPGLVDQAAALGTGWREFRGEMATGMAAREHDLTHQLGPSVTAHPDTDPESSEGPTTPMKTAP